MPKTICWVKTIQQYIFFILFFCKFQRVHFLSNSIPFQAVFALGTQGNWDPPCPKNVTFIIFYMCVLPIPSGTNNIDTMVFRIIPWSIYMSILMKSKGEIIRENYLKKMSWLVHYQQLSFKQIVLTLPMLRLFSSKAQGHKDFWKPSKPCHVGILCTLGWVPMCQGFSRFSVFFWLRPC